MDTPTTPLRSPAQTAASKTNGAMSAGPVTAAGKAVASANGTVHGLAARGVLLPSERAQDYQANLNDWFETLGARSRGEGLLAARVADVGWRLGRLSRLEERLVNAALERRLAESGPANAPAPVRFVELAAAAAPAEGAAGFEVVLAGGRVVRVPPRFDGAELSRLVQVLEEARS